MTYPVIKRAIDLVGAALLLLLFGLPLLAIAALIKAVDGEDALFRQARPGKREKIFTMYKFKTMTARTHAPDGRLLTDMERVTRLGSWLRRASLDELPQLFNILKGDMSFIGPRPLLVRYLGHYSAFQARRHEVTPGISGWAQVHGRNRAAWDDRLALDVWYADHFSFGLDVKIFFMTLKNVLSQSGVNRGDGETMPFFDERDD